MNDKLIRTCMSNDMGMLIPLYILLQECHVTKAANRLNISQSSMSQYLSKIRKSFNDKILVRNGNEMVLTPAAEKILPELEVIFAAMDNIYHIKDFTPGEVKRKFVIAASDMNKHLSKRFVTWTSEHINQYEVELVPRTRHIFDELSNGQVDFIIGNFSEIPQHYHVRKLSRIRYRLYDSTSNPIINDLNNEISALAKKNFITLSGIGEAEKIAEKLFTTLNLKRNIAFAASTLDQVKDGIIDHDLLGFLPDVYSSCDGIYSVSESLTFEVDICLYWHPKMHNDPEHIWMREEIYKIAQVD
ncbi:LysR family transcriptional regulator [Vibrio inusitatus NBRC 102082]|uniref:LysR family transcriptional regulator n=1 Tax=Vibrio inusitatus NBRC 102082 TaxID=1219070 RepID=A0A4Y3HR61_9VIBR|nr:LysR family transcriptional regulator [Vibrio inusitatus]GEA49517.1 LysR family transcriptional regulator [Vibrio inusitatus NBRC 102082]